MVVLAAASLAGCASGRPASGPPVGSRIQHCDSCPVMVVVPPGQFRMGSEAGERDRDADEGPARTVRFARPFAIGVYEVTRAQYAAFVQDTGRIDAPSCMTWTGARLESVGGRGWRDPGVAQQDDHPVVCVSWRDAAAYAAWLAQRTGQPYRLPSEAEWEYAARGGTTSAHAFGGTEADACAYGNIGDRSARQAVPGWRTADCDDGVGLGTAPVGRYRPNGFGLFDTVGNVWEWVADCYRPGYDGAPTDGSAWGDAGECNAALDRGGGFSALFPGHLRAANRSRAPSPDNPAYSLGFRVALDLGATGRRSSRGR
jgi:formylglycine-generating enzyme required for sulfatase activity